MINKFNSVDKNIINKENKRKRIVKDKDGNIESIGVSSNKENKKYMNKERTKSLIVMIITFLILLFFISQIWLLGNSILGKNVNKNSMILSNIIDPIVGLFLKPEEHQPPIVEESSVKIGAVGDIYVTNAMLKGYKKSGEYDFDSAFEQIKIYTQEYDYVLANLETPIAGDSEGLSTTKKYNAPLSILSSLKKANINILSLANEKVLDKEDIGLKNTIKNIEEAGLKSVGASKTNSPSEPVILEKDNIRVSILSYNDTAYTLGKGKENMINIYSEDKAKSDIESLKSKNVDAIVVYMHYGNLGQTRPTAQQREITSKLYELGADVVFGSHPHVIQPVSDEIFSINENDKKRVYVAYSLGDFLGTATEADSDFSVITGVTFKKEIKKNKKGEILSKNVSLIPEETLITWQDKKLKDGTNMRRVIPVKKAIAEFENNTDKDISNADYIQMQEAFKEATKILIRQ